MIRIVTNKRKAQVDIVQYSKIFSVLILPTSFVKRFIYSTSVSKYELSLNADPTTPYFYDFRGQAVEWIIGYKILDKSNFYLYPYVGLNLNTSKLIISRRDSSSISSMNDIISTPDNKSEIKYSNNALDVGMSFERIFKSRAIGSCPRNVRYFCIGLSAGYLTKLHTSNNTYYRDRKVADGENFGLDGAYVKLSIGYGIKLRRVAWE